MKKQLQEQVGENLWKLAAELVTQIDDIESSLGIMRGGHDVIMLPAPKIPRFSELGLDAKDPFRAEICNQPGFTWLFGQPEFKLAYEHFEKKIETTKISDGEIVLLKTRFVHSFAGYGWLAFSESSSLPKTISKKKKTRAVQLAKELLAFLEEGVGRPDFIYMDAVRHPLRRFIDYLDKATPREYSADRQKYVLTNLALRLHELGLKEKDVVILVDKGVALFNFDRSHRQVQRYVSDAFSH